MSIINEARALMAVLAPLSGTRATGNLTVNALPSPTGSLPEAQYAAPILGGSIRYDRLIKTAQNPAGPPATADGRKPTPFAYTVGTATVVPVVSNVGGADQNLAAGTVVRWFPTVAGIEPTSVVAAGGLTGGTAGTDLASVKRIAFFEEIQIGGKAGGDLWKTLVDRFPALVLAWAGSDPGDNQASGPLNQAGARAGRGHRLQKQDWELFVISSRQDAAAGRALEGVAILDAATNLLVDRQNADGYHFSSPTGVHITGRRRWFVDSALYVYQLKFSTISSLSMQDARSFNPWAKTKLDMQTTDTQAFPTVVDNEFPMPQ